MPSIAAPVATTLLEASAAVEVDDAEIDADALDVLLGSALDELVD
jgi:hypothetical protein